MYVWWWWWWCVCVCEREEGGWWGRQNHYSSPEIGTLMCCVIQETDVEKKENSSQVRQFVRYTYVEVLQERMHSLNKGVSNEVELAS